MASVTLVLKRVFYKGHIAFALPEELSAKQALTKVLLGCHKSSDFVTCTFETPQKPRTTGKGSQNHHLNGHILQICNETGNDYDTVKYAVKMLAVEQMGYPYKQLAGQIIPKRERDCSTEECALLIEAVHYLAADLGVILKE